MSMTTEELEQLPPQGHVKIVYQGPTSPHWEVRGVFGDGRVIDEFRQRALARLQLLPPHDPQFRRNRERVNRDAERERLILEWDLGYVEEEAASAPSDEAAAAAPTETEPAATETAAPTA